MIKMPLTVLSVSIANSPGSISISLTGMHGTFLLSEFFFSLINMPAAQILILTEQQKKKYDNWSEKKAFKGNALLGLSRKTVYSGTG